MDKYALPGTNKGITINKGYILKYNVHQTAILQLESEEENVENRKSS